MLPPPPVTVKPDGLPVEGEGAPAGLLQTREDRGQVVDHRVSLAKRAEGFSLSRSIGLNARSRRKRDGSGADDRAQGRNTAAKHQTGRTGQNGVLTLRSSVPAAVLEGCPAGKRERRARQRAQGRIEQAQRSRSG